MAVLDPFAERKGAGADDVNSARRLILLRGGQDHEGEDRRLHNIEQDDIRLLEINHERVGIRRLVTVDAGQIGGVRTDAPIALHRRLRARGRHLLAAMKLDALAQMERIGLAIGRGRHARGQHRLRGVRFIQRDERSKTLWIASSSTRLEDTWGSRVPGPETLA